MATKSSKLTQEQLAELDEVRKRAMAESMEDGMAWIRHDVGAMRDTKLVRLRMRRGHAGIGMWWALVEAMAAQPLARCQARTDEDWGVIAYDMGLADADEARGFVADAADLGLVDAEMLGEGIVASSRLSGEYMEMVERAAQMKVNAARTNMARDLR